MEPKLFKPSIDWSTATTESLWWLAKGWVIAAVCVLVVLVLLRYLTGWGRQYWRITGGYFTGRHAVRTWVQLAVLLLLVLLSVRLTVLLSYQSNDLYSSLQTAFEGTALGNERIKQSGMHGFWMSLVHFSVLATLFIVRLLVDIYLTQRFIIAWRIWLTAYLTDDWLAGRAYYRDLFIDNTIDNPDQRIQQDVDIFTTGAGGTPNIPSNETANTLLFGAVRAVVSVVSFAAILWHLSGRLGIFGFDLPRAMFWIVVIYVVIATGVAFKLGRPLIWLSFNNEKLNAAFRYALVRLRDAAEAVGFYRGEQVERAQLLDDSTRSSTTTAVLSAGRSCSTAGTGRCRRQLFRCRGSSRHRGCSPGRSLSATSGRRPRPLVKSTTRCRSSATTMTRSPPSVRRSSVCTGWSTPTPRAATCPRC